MNKDEDLLSQEQELRTAYQENGFKGPFLIDYRNDIIKLGRETCEMFALDVEEHGRGVSIGSIDHLHHPDDIAWVKEMRRQPAGILGQKISEFRVIDCRDDVRWIQIRSRIQHDRHGLPLIEKGVVFDITDLKRERVFINTAPVSDPDLALDRIVDGLMSAYATAVEIGNREIQQRLSGLILDSRVLVPHRHGYDSAVRH